MPALVDLLANKSQRLALVADCTDLVDAQVKRKGLFVRSAYATIKALKRGIVPEVIDSMLDQWVAKLQFYYDVWLASGTGRFPDYLAAHSDVVAEDLLSVTDARAAKSSRATVKKMYLRMRDSAKDNVVEALPELSRVVDRHLTPMHEAATAPTAVDAVNA